MPNKHAALKQLRKDHKRATNNQAVISELKTLKKRITLLLEQNKTEEALRSIPIVMKRYDQAAAKGVIHKNIAARTKSRLMHRLGSISGKVILPALKSNSSSGKATKPSAQGQGADSTSQT
jgi:small subunit ribosomal protein S20